MSGERTTVGLDVHARSIAAEAVDWSTGQVVSDTLVPDHEVVLAWLARLPGPVAVTYEAGPTGFGLARALQAARVRCVVVAPSKLERPPGDRVKTDRRDARRLCRLLHIGEIDDAGAVRVPAQVEEDARDLVRAREATRADLMRARHRLSKLLLRHGIVYSGGQAWTGPHEAWLRRQRFDRPGTRAAFEEYFDAVLSVTARRDRLDAAIAVTAAPEPWAPIVARLGASAAWPRSPAWAWRSRSGTGPGSPAPASAPTSAWCPASPPAAPAAARARSPRPATPTLGGCWSRPPGTTRSRCGPPARPCRPPRRAPAAVRARGEAADRRLHHRWQQDDRGTSGPPSSRVAVARELAGWCWSLAIMDTDPGPPPRPKTGRWEEPGAGSREERPASSTMSSPIMKVRIGHARP